MTALSTLNGLWGDGAWFYPFVKALLLLCGHWLLHIESMVYFLFESIISSNLQQCPWHKLINKQFDLDNIKALYLLAA